MFGKDESLQALLSTLRGTEELAETLGVGFGFGVGFAGPIHGRVGQALRLPPKKRRDIAALIVQGYADVLYRIDSASSCPA